LVCRPRMAAKDQRLVWPSMRRRCFSVSSQAEATQRCTMSASRHRVTLWVRRSTLQPLTVARRYFNRFFKGPATASCRRSSPRRRCFRFPCTWPPEDTGTEDASGPLYPAYCATRSCSPVLCPFPPTVPSPRPRQRCRVPSPPRQCPIPGTMNKRMESMVFLVPPSFSATPL
jgi:hypothetical protein